LAFYKLVASHLADDAASCESEFGRTTNLCNLINDFFFKIRVMTA